MSEQVNKSLLRLLLELMFPYALALIGVGSLVAIIVLDLSRDTMILLYAGLHGVGLAILMIALFGAMRLHARP
jgi:hypothetical protein